MARGTRGEIERKTTTTANVVGRIAGEVHELCCLFLTLSFTWHGGIAMTVVGLVQLKCGFL